MRKILFSLVISTLFTGCAVENINYITPVMVTYQPENIQTKSASMGGLVLGEGGKDVTEYGLVWATTDPPTTADNKIAKGSRIGEFYDNYELFQPSTTYYYRSYGINEVGTGYGETYSFTTQGLPACSPAQNNRVEMGPYTINVTSVTKTFDTYDDGNVEFRINGTPYGTYIRLEFNEIDSRLPLSGTYDVIYDFSIGNPKSQAHVVLTAVGFPGWEMLSGIGEPGDKLYIENNNGQLTFIFCSMELSQNFTLNGKATYTE